MTKKLYVGNIPYAINSQILKEIFSHAGQVEDARVIRDKFTKRSKGYGFVEMKTETEAQAAIIKFHEAECEGRKFTVTLANKQELKKADSKTTSEAPAVEQKTEDSTPAATHSS